MMEENVGLFITTPKTQGLQCRGLAAFPKHWDFSFFSFFLLRNHSWEFNYIRAGDYWKKLRFHCLGTEPMFSFLFVFLCFIPNSLGMALQLLSQPTCISEVIVTKVLCPKLTPSNVLTGWSLNYILCIFSFFSSSFVVDPATQCVSVKD